MLKRLRFGPVNPVFALASDLLIVKAETDSPRSCHLHHFTEIQENLFLFFQKIFYAFQG